MSSFTQSVCTPSPPYHTSTQRMAWHGPSPMLSCLLVVVSSPEKLKRNEIKLKFNVDLIWFFFRSVHTEFHERDNTTQDKPRQDGLSTQPNDSSEIYYLIFITSKTIMFMSFIFCLSNHNSFSWSPLLCMLVTHRRISFSHHHFQYSSPESPLVPARRAN